MKKFYVSLVEDLNGCYLEFNADSEEAVRLYLEKHYLKDRQWKLPWCSVYSQLPPLRYPGQRQIVIEALTTEIYEEDYRWMRERGLE